VCCVKCYMLAIHALYSRFSIHTDSTKERLDDALRNPSASSTGTPLWRARWTRCPTWPVSNDADLETISYSTGSFCAGTRSESVCVLVSRLGSYDSVLGPTLNRRSPIGTLVALGKASLQLSIGLVLVMSMANNRG
jgi:hypothetical protein